MRLSVLVLLLIIIISILVLLLCSYTDTNNTLYCWGQAAGYQPRPQAGG